MICLVHMNRINLISCYWLLKKTLVITTNLNNPESASDTQLNTKMAFIFYKYMLPLKGHCYYILKLNSTPYELCFNWPASSRERNLHFPAEELMDCRPAKCRDFFSFSFFLFKTLKRSLMDFYKRKLTNPKTFCRDLR